MMIPISNRDHFFAFMDLIDFNLSQPFKNPGVAISVLHVFISSKF